MATEDNLLQQVSYQEQREDKPAAFGESRIRLGASHHRLVGEAARREWPV